MVPERFSAVAQSSPIAWGQNIVFSNGKTFPVQRPTSGVGKLAGWAIGKVIGKGGSSSTEEVREVQSVTPLENARPRARALKGRSG
jgi:hypothetical protein